MRQLKKGRVELYFSKSFLSDSFSCILNSMIRLDKYLSNVKNISRQESKRLIKEHIILVNGESVSDSNLKINELDTISVDGKILGNGYEPFVYYMMNKPKGYVSATKDEQELTVLSLMDQNLQKKDLSLAGRLDKNTEGFLLITNDGALSHRLLSPKSHIEKIYFVSLKFPLCMDDIRCLENGVDIGEKNRTLPATIKSQDERNVYITITEGKFHQIKRMFLAVHNQVVFLKRTAMGGVTLDESLKAGEYRELTKVELETLKYETDYRTDESSNF